MIRPWSTAAIFWTFVALLYAAQLYLMASQPGERIVLRTALIWNVSYYLCWIPLTPPIWVLIARWSERAVPVAALLCRHAILAIVAIVLHTAASMLIAGFFMPQYLTGTMFVGQLRGRFVTGVLMYVAIAGSGVAFTYYARWREGQLAASRLESELSAARLQSLKAQFHPHFLFNSLHAIASLVRTGDSNGAVKAIAGLSDLLRHVLDADRRETISLGEEAAFAQRYFDIQRVRFGDRLNASVDLEPATEAIAVPPLILQPLIENALLHGVGERIEGGAVHVRARRVSGSLEIAVEDDGDGLPEGWQMDSQNGLGLRATRARLQQRYGTAFAFDVARREPRGTRATIRISAP